ncbi:MAG: DNA topoisomerase IV subunit A [Traorella sp.]
MAKKEEIIQENIITTPLEEIMGDRFGRYSKYIIQERALPDARDGLKPVQRRILYSMYESGYTHQKQHRKSARIVGDVMGKYHPHGDSSIYEAMVRMSQNWKTRETLIDMHGNNGSMDDDPPAAMRYTEARLTQLASYMLEDIDKDTVEFAPNFDDTEMEPTVLPAKYPNLLVNGISGIAAGYATNIPPHNLGEVLDAAIYRIQRENCSLEELMEFVLGPDFPTGGIVQGIDGIKDAFTTGKGRIVVRSKCEVVQTKTNQQIIVHEIPYDVIKSNLVKKIDEIRINKTIDGILDVRDESDRNGLRICIDLKKDANSDLILNYLYKNTDLQVYFNYNVVAIVNKRPMQLGLAAMLDAFIAHRKEVVTRRCRYELDKMEKRCHILEGLIQAISVLDEVIAIIRSSKGKADSKIRLIDRFHFSEVQAEAIVTLQLYRLSNTDVLELKNEFASLVNKMEELKDILSNPKLLKKVIINECKQVKKEFATPRLTKIEDKIEEIVIDKVAMVNSEQVMLTVSKDGYVKKVSLRSYASSNDMTGLKDQDELIGYKEVNTLDYFLFVTSKGTYGYAPVYELDEAKWKEIGSHLNSTLTMTSNEKIIAAYTLKSFHTGAYLVTLSKKGMIKKTPIKDLEVQRNNKTMLLMNLKDDDEIVDCQIVVENEEIIIVTKDNYTSRYNADLIAPTAPKGKGIIAMKNDQCQAVVPLRTTHMVCICESGSMKRLKMSDISLTGRPVRGELIAKKVKSNPNHILYALGCDNTTEIILQSEKTLKIQAKDISLMSKDATYSTAIKIQKPFYLQKGIHDIPQVEIVEKEITSNNKEIDQASLFD